VNTDLKNEVESSSSGTLWITLQVFSLQRKNKTAKRRPTNHDSRDVKSKSAGYDRSSKTTTYLSCVQ
jgi:hypothetical protein